MPTLLNTIIGASNQSVVINGAGIQVGGDSKYQLRIVDNMIAMTDDGWKTAKLGIGRFYSDAKTGLKDDKGNDILIGETWGINTELLAGSLIIGNNLVLENANDNGVMQFKVDATGAWLYNASYIMQHDDGGLMIFDPKYGIVAGNKLLFNTNGTTVTPEFIDDWGDIKFDADGMPENANFYLDLRDGSAYFRGRIKADSGSIGGWELAENELHCGSNSTFVALNSSKDTNSLYAIWAGATKPENAKFWVKRDGTLHARDGEFTIDFVGGSTQELVFHTFFSQNKKPFDLSSCTASFALINFVNKNGSPLIAKPMEVSKSEDGDGTVTNVLRVVLLPEETVDLVGKFIYQITIQDISGEIEIPDQGIIRIANNINKSFPH